MDTLSNFPALIFRQSIYTHRSSDTPVFLHIRSSDNNKINAWRCRDVECPFFQVLLFDVSVLAVCFTILGMSSSHDRQMEHEQQTKIERYTLILTCLFFLTNNPSTSHFSKTSNCRPSSFLLVTTLVTTILTRISSTKPRATLCHEACPGHSLRALL